MRKLLFIIFSLIACSQAHAIIADYPVNTATLNASVWGQTWVQHAADANARDDLDIENHNLITVDGSGNTKWTGSLIVTGSAVITAGLSVASTNAATGQIKAATAQFSGIVTMNSLVERDFSYGEMYVSYNATAMNLALADTYYTVTSNVVAGDLGNFTFTNSGTDCYLTVGKSGLYAFIGSLSFSGGNGDEFHGGLSINDAVPSGCCEFNRKMGAGGDVGSASFSGIVRLSATNTLRVKIENDTDADDPTIKMMNLSVYRISQ